MACAESVWQARFRYRPAGQHSSDLTLEVFRQTVRLLVVRRRNRCWDDVPCEVCGEHLTIRSPAVSSALPMVPPNQVGPGKEERMLFVGDDWAEDHHDIEI